MRSKELLNFASDFQTGLYDKFHSFSKENKLAGRLLGIFVVAPIDVIADSLKAPLGAIEGVVMTIMNLIGAFFKPEKYNLKNALHNAEGGLSDLARFPVVITMALPKVIYQALVNAAYPTRAYSIDYRN